MSQASILRKTFLGIFAFLLTAALFTGCGKKEDDSKTNVIPGREDFIRGKAAFDTEEYATAITHFMLASDQGNVEAQYYLGKTYFKMYDKETEGIKWFRKAAENGNAEAQYELGKSYYDGKGLEEDQEEAVKWYRKAAEQGHAEAQYELASCYQDGLGVKLNTAEAIKWFREAAKQGHTFAKRELERFGEDEE